MKKLIFLLSMFFFMGSAAMACHIESLGQCEKAFYITKLFNPNSTYYFREYGTTDTILRFQTGAIVKDSLISFNLPAGSQIEMRYKYTDSSDNQFTDWLYQEPAKSINYCSVLSIGISNLSVQKVSGTVFVNFIPGDEESQVQEYRIRGSIDSKQWVTIKTVLPGSKSYHVPISTAVVVSSLFPFLFLFTKRRKWFSFVALLFLITFYSCKKDAIITDPISSYNYIQVQTVDKSGNLEVSKIIRL